MDEKMEGADTTGSSVNADKTSRLTRVGFGAAAFLLLLLLVSQGVSCKQTRWRLAQEWQPVDAVEGVGLLVTWPTHLLIDEEKVVTIEAAADMGWTRPFTLTVELPPGVMSDIGARTVEWDVLPTNGRSQQLRIPIQNAAIFSYQVTQPITLSTTLQHSLEPLAITLESTNWAIARHLCIALISQNGPLLLVIAAVISIASLVFQEQERVRNWQLRQNEQRFKEERETAQEQAKREQQRQEAQEKQHQQQIELAQKQAEREQQRLEAEKKQRQQQVEQQENIARQKTKEQANKLRIYLANADKISLLRLWSVIDPEFLQELADHDWLTLLVKLSLSIGLPPDANVFGEIAQTWPVESAGAFICSGINNKILYDKIPLEKVTDFALRNKLIQMQHNRLPLQDWPPAFSLPENAIARSPLENTLLAQLLIKDPLLYERAEDELSSLFDEDAFWIEHPMYRQIAIATRSQVVYGVKGCGRTALARALCHHEPQYQRYYWAYIPVFATVTTKHDLRNALAEQLLQYVLNKPTLLHFLREEERVLLASVLSQALSSAYVLAKVAQELSYGGWYNQVDPTRQNIWRTIGETQLEMLMQCVHKNAKLSKMQWLPTCQGCFTMLGFRGLRLVLDLADDEDEMYAELKMELNAWRQVGVVTTVFMSDNSLATRLQGDIARQMLVLDWSSDQLDQLIRHRFNRLAKRGPDLVFSTEAYPIFLRNIQTPRDAVELWSAILQTTLLSAEDTKILPEHVTRGKTALHREEQAITLPDFKTVRKQQEKQEQYERVRKITQHFSLNELKNLCYALVVEYEDLPGETLSAKARELVEYMTRHDRLPELLEKLQQERPFFRW